MTRRRTIGENPLDSISVPTRSRETRKRSEAATADQGKPSTAPTFSPSDERPQEESGNQERPGTSSPKSGSLRTQWERLRHRGRMHILEGDGAPSETKLTVPYLGEAKGFRLRTGEFVTIKRDVVRATVRSEKVARRTRKLLLWSTIGAFVAGPLGALAGSVYGGWPRHTTVLELELHDGRTLLVAAHPAVTDEIRAELG